MKPNHELKSDVIFTAAHVAMWLGISEQDVEDLSPHLPPPQHDGWAFDRALIEALVRIENEVLTSR